MLGPRSENIFVDALLFLCIFFEVEEGLPEKNILCHQ